MSDITKWDRLARGQSNCVFYRATKSERPRLALALLALSVGLMAGCGSDSGPVMNPGPSAGGGPVPPTPVQMRPGNGSPCICPGPAGRLVNPCPGSNSSGQIIISFVCPASHAVFSNHCHFTATTDNAIVLQIAALGNPLLEIPITGPNEVFPVVFDTIATVGTANVSITDLFDNSVTRLGAVTVSNSCQ